MQKKSSILQKERELVVPFKSHTHKVFEENKLEF